jgi:ABC-type spermidine/putrescine transport system permease subunit II
VLRPGITLVVIGQFAFITTIATLVISARLRKFDITLEEAAMNLGASRLTAVMTVTIPFLSCKYLSVAGGKTVMPLVLVNGFGVNLPMANAFR